MKRNLGLKFKRLHRPIGLVLLVLLLRALLPAALPVEAVTDDTFRVFITNEPDSLVEPCLERLFPEGEIDYVLSPELVDVTYQPALILMPEHQAYPLLEQGIGAAFQPLYRASLVFGRLVEGEKPTYQRLGYSDLTPELFAKNHVISLVPNRYLTAAIRERVGEDNYKQILKNLREPYENGTLEFFNSEVDGEYKFLPDDYLTGDLPDLVFAYDYQLASWNMQLEDLGRDVRYDIEVPKEGSLLIDFGLFATNRAAASMLNLRVGPDAPPEAIEPLIELGFRLPDGSHKDAPYFPSDDDYFKIARIKNYYTFNEEEMHDQAVFYRNVLGLSILTPGSAEEELMSYFFLTVIFVAWMISLFYRLDEPQTRLPLTLYLISLAVWIFTRMIELLLPNKVQAQNVFSYIPVFFLAFAWLFLGWRRVARQRRQTVWMKRIFLILSAVLLIFTILALTNDYHHLFLKYSEPSPADAAYGILTADVSRPAVLLYPFFFFLLAVFVYGYYLLKVAREQSCSTFCLILPLLLIAAAFIYNGYYIVSGSLLSQRAFTRNNAIIAAVLLELMLRLRFLPANTKYFRFFRYNPLGMRLISDDLEDIYTPDHLPDLTVDEKRWLQSEIVKTFPQPEETVASRFDFRKKKKREPKPISDEIHKVPLPHDPDSLMSIREIHGGYLIWQENIKDIRKLRERLSDLSERLEQQQHILKQEQNVQTHLTSSRIRRTLLASLEQQLSEKMTEIRAAIKELEKCEDTDDQEALKAKLGRLKIMVSQAKRKSNLLVRAEPDLSLDELRLIFKEALKDAESSGISGIVIVQGEGTIPTDKALFFYDYLQELLQQNAHLERMSVFLMLEKTKEHIQLQLVLNGGDALDEACLDVTQKLGERQKALGVHTSLEQEDQDYRLRLTMKEDDHA